MIRPKVFIIGISALIASTFTFFLGRTSVENQGANDLAHSTHPNFDPIQKCEDGELRKELLSFIEGSLPGIINHSVNQALQVQLNNIQQTLQSEPQSNPANPGAAETPIYSAKEIEKSHRQTSQLLDDIFAQGSLDMVSKMKLHSHLGKLPTEEQAVYLSRLHQGINNQEISMDTFFE